MIPVPQFLWQRAIRTAAHKTRLGTRFMGDDHHRVRDFVVTELLRTRRPLSPDRIAAALGLGLDRTTDLLAALEQRRTFLFRDEGGAVTWAYPVTVDETPHHGVFITGEEAYSP